MPTTKQFTSDASVASNSISYGGATFFMLTMICSVKRRADNYSVDILNEPSYGDVKDWDNIYVNIPCRLEVSNSNIQFKPTGERIPPKNILYVDASTPLQVEDRVIFSNNNVNGLGFQQEFIVQGCVPALDQIGQPSHHLEYELLCP